MAKTVVRCRDLLKTRWAGKGSYVNGLVKKGAGGRGKSSSYSLKTRRAERVHGWSRHINWIEKRREVDSCKFRI